MRKTKRLSERTNFLCELLGQLGQQIPLLENEGFGSSAGAQNAALMSTTTPQPKERLGLLRFEVISIPTGRAVSAMFGRKAHLQPLKGLLRPLKSSNFVRNILLIRRELGDQFLNSRVSGY